jgi:hypothetical protein
MLPENNVPRRSLFKKLENRHVFSSGRACIIEAVRLQFRYREWRMITTRGRIMRSFRVLVALGLWCSINPGFATNATAEDRPATNPTDAKPSQDAKQAREKFAKLLLPNGPKKSADKTSAKRRGAVVNAFGGGTRVILP